MRRRCKFLDRAVEFTKGASVKLCRRKVVHLNAHYVNEHDILWLRQEFIDLDGGLQLEGDVGIIERYTKQLFKLF